MQDLLKYDGRKSEDSDCASLFIGILTCGDCRTPMIRKKKGLLLEGYHAGYCTREGYLEGGRELEQRISGLEQRRARIRDDMAECEKLPESERKGQEFLQLSEPDLGGECYYSVKLEEIPKNQGVPLISSKRKNVVKSSGGDENDPFSSLKLENQAT